MLNGLSTELGSWFNYYFYRMIQFGSHYFSQVEGITQRFCQIRKTLGMTHDMVYGEAWGLERWDRRYEKKSSY